MAVTARVSMQVQAETVLNETAKLDWDFIKTAKRPAFSIKKV